MGTTGLETAFAALYTELVLPGELDSRDVIERMTAGASLYEPADAEDRAGRACEFCAHRPRRALGGRRTRLREPLGELLLPRPQAPRPRAADARRGSGRLPRARAAMRAAASTMSAAPLRPARGRRPFRRRRVRRRRAAVGEIVFTTSMSGYQEAMTDPSYAGQLLAFTFPMIGNYGVSEEAMESDRIHAAPRSCARGSTARTRPNAEGGWLTWLVRLRDPRDHRARHACARAPHPRSRGDARRRLPRRAQRARGAGADRRRTRDERPRPRP